MMLLHQSMPVASRWLRYVAALAILVLAPLGLSVAQDHGNRGSDQQRLESGTLSTTASDETMLTAETSRLLLTETAEIRRWHAERLTELESLSSRINAGFEVAASDSDRAAALLAELRSFRAEIERQAMRAAAERREKADQLLELLAEEYPSGPTADAATR